MSNAALDVEATVAARYAQGARERQPALCCPVSYDARYLEPIPQEVIDKDYGCGDPSRYIGVGERVLDLGSGSGKSCFIAAQVVGKTGRVIGVDMNDDMLTLARKHAPIVAERLGYDNVEFRKGRIQDLTLDHERLDDVFKAEPVNSAADYQRAESALARNAD